MKTYKNKGIEYIMGSNAEENWKIIGLAEREDYWVHLRDYPSAHIIVKIDKIEQEELEYARELILKNTRKAPRTAEIVYSKVRNIKRGGKVGEVIVKTAKE